MAKVERFEDLLAWQKARELTRAVYSVTRDGPFARDFGLAGQMQRAAVSIMSNVAEGFERWSPTEFHHFLTIAKGSCAELRAQMYVALDAGYLDQDTFTRLQQQAASVAELVGALRLSVQRRRDSS